MTSFSNDPSPERLQLSFSGETSPPVILAKNSGELLAYTAQTAKMLHARLGGDCLIDGQSIRGWFPNVDVLVVNSWRAPSIDFNTLSTFEELRCIPLTGETRNDVSRMAHGTSRIFIPVDQDSLTVSSEMFSLMRITSPKGEAFLVATLKEAIHYLQTGEIDYLQADCEVIAINPASPIENLFGYGFYVSSELQSTLGVPAVYAAGYLLFVTGPDASLVEDGATHVEHINLHLVKPGEIIWEGLLGAIMNKKIGHEKIGPLGGGDAE